MNLCQGPGQLHLACLRRHLRHGPVTHCFEDGLPDTAQARLHYLDLIGNLLHPLPGSTNFRD